MEIKKPKKFDPQLENAIKKLKGEMNELGMLSNYPEEHHKKITRDFGIVGSLISQMPTEENVISECLRKNIYCGYFTLLSISEYQVDVDNFLESYLNIVKDLIDGEGLGGMILKLGMETGLLIPEIVDEIMTNELILFIIKYSNQHWPGSIENFNGINLEPLI